MEKYIELFPGSKANLEALTDEHYEAMKRPDGTLLIVTVPESKSNGMRGSQMLPTYPMTIKDAQILLRNAAKKAGADALVHCQYPVQLFSPLVSSTKVYLEIPAYGYAVKVSPYGKERPC